MLQDVDRAVAAPPATALRRYGVALGSVAFALLLSLLARPLSEPNPLLLFVAAIALSAWFGGLTSWFVTTSLTALVSDSFLLTSARALCLGLTDILRIDTAVFLAQRCCHFR